MHKPASDEAVTSLHDLSAVDLIEGFKAGQFSPSEVLEDVLAHVAVWEPHIKALYVFDPDGARAVARASTERWHKGEPMGVLDGVPVTIKDNIATKGVPVPLGAASMPLVPAERDAPPAARLREAGAVIFSKTTMPDYGMLSSGLSSFHPLTRNPWDVSKNPGGSSSGAGAAGAAGYGPLHLGTDIGGSVRLPACWNGIFTLKPSLGRVPVDPPFLGRVVGPMTRTVADSALLMTELSKPDARDHMSLPPAGIDWSAGPLEPKGLRNEPVAAAPAEPTLSDRVVRIANIAALAGHLESHVPASGACRSIVVGDASSLDPGPEAVELAKELATRGHAVIVVDWSPDSSGLAQGLGLARTPGMTELFEGAAKFEDVVQRLPNSSAHFIASGAAMSYAAEGPEADQINLILDALDEAYAHIIVAGPYEASRNLFEVIEGRFDCGVTIVDAKRRVSVIQDPPGTFLGYEVADMEIVRYERKDGAVPAQRILRATGAHRGEAHPA